MFNILHLASLPNPQIIKEVAIHDSVSSPVNGQFLNLINYQLYQQPEMVSPQRLQGNQVTTWHNTRKIGTLLTAFSIEGKEQRARSPFSADHQGVVGKGVTTDTQKSRASQSVVPEQQHWHHSAASQKCRLLSSWPVDLPWEPVLGQEPCTLQFEEHEYLQSIILYCTFKILLGEQLSSKYSFHNKIQFSMFEEHYSKCEQLHVPSSGSSATCREFLNVFLILGPLHRIAEILNI